MMQLLIAIIIILFPVFSWGACVGPTQSEVVTAVADATAGDTIEVCSGTATWSTESGSHLLTITKGIRLIGSGADATTITLAGTSDVGQIYYAPDADNINSNATFELSGFTFDGNSASKGQGLVRIYNSHATTAISNIKIHGNTFRSSGHTTVQVDGLVYGVIYNNIFTDCNYIVRADAANKGWTAGIEQTFGTSTNLFIEDNLINATTSGEMGYSDPGQGAPGFVLRYNTYDFTNNASGNTGLWDFHGLQSMAVTSGYTCPSGCGYTSGDCPQQDSCDDTQEVCGLYSAVKGENYGNEIKNVTSPFSNWNGQRGGAQLMFYNKLSGSGNTSTYYNLKYSQFSCDSCQNNSTKYVQHITKSYNWANYAGSTLKTMSKQYDFCADNAKTSPSPYTITENVDYWNHNPSFDGTSGVGCGTLANRPATCTTGVGYWATTQSCSDLEGIVGANPSTKISGTLYKCTDTNTWTAYYTPYQYPHPLRGGRHKIGSGPQFSIGAGATVTIQ